MAGIPRHLSSLTDETLELLERVGDPKTKSRLMQGLELSRFRDEVHADREQLLEQIKLKVYELCEENITTRSDSTLLAELTLLLEHKRRCKTKQGMKFIRHEIGRVLSEIIVSIWAAESELKC